MRLIRYLLLLALCVAPLSHAQGFFERLPLLGNSKPDFLPPDQAFGLKISVRDARTLIASFRVTPDYYLYRDRISFKLADGTAGNVGVKIVNLSLPRGEMKQDPNFGEQEVFHKSFTAEIALERSNNAAQHITLETSYQGCSEKGLCYAPIDKQINIALPVAIPALAAITSSKAAAATPATASASAVQSAAAAQAVADPAPPESATPASTAPLNDDSRITQLFKQGSFWLIVSFFMGAGLLLAFTPCVFPMIPILSGIIVGHGPHLTRMHAFILSLAYVLGMALTYSAVGVAAGLSGTLLSNALQTPWVLGSFAGVFVLLALSMFGFYELQLPGAVQTRLTSTSNRLHGGHLSGTFVMGALSAIIVGPCVAAPLAGALLYIGRTHDALLGGVALFALAMGMGLPLLVLGASAGSLLPKAGAWMESVKRFFGVLLLAVAIWMISSLIPVSVQMLLWAVLLVLSAVYLHALDALSPSASGLHKLWKGVGILALLLGIAYLVGALSGARDILRPLSFIGSSQAQAPLHFVRVKNLAELDARIAQAGGKPVMLDFYADWCVSCKEMERDTFSDARVRARLSKVLLVQADVTANSAEDKALLQHFELFGPPAILFFDAQGKEAPATRVTGYQDSEQFLRSLQNTGL